MTIEEADGTKRTFSQPFSSVVQMLRPGVGRWDISAGQVLKDSIQDEPNLFQASYYYGLNNYLTGYTGIQLTDNNYTAGLLGLGMNTPVGAFLSMLLTQMSAFRTIKPIKDKATVFPGTSYLKIPVHH